MKQKEERCHKQRSRCGRGERQIVAKQVRTVRATADQQNIKKNTKSGTVSVRTACLDLGQSNFCLRYWLHTHTQT